MTPEGFIALWHGDSEFRENQLYGIVRSVRKYGDFSLASAISVLAIPDLLTTEEVLELYRHIRKEGQRMEAEWRPHFDEAFAHVAHLLPELDRKEVAEMYAIDLFLALFHSREPATVEQVLSDMSANGFTLAGLPPVHEMSFGEGYPFFCRGKELEPHAVSWEEVAKRCNHRELERLLKDALSS